MCKKTFTWRDTKDGQIYCSKICALSDPNVPVGRPSVMTSEVLEKLKYAYMADSTDEEACIYAGISTAVLYKYQKRIPEFKEQKREWKQRPVLAARVKVVNDIPQNIETAKWYLERKRKNEFSAKSFVQSEVLTGEMDENARKRALEVAKELGEDL